jgi:phosphonate transport system substrate-binding protein
MRRLVPLAALLVGGLFAAIVVPGSPLLSQLLSAISGPAQRALPVRSAGPRVSGRPLRVAVGAMISPERTYQHYREVFEEIALRRGRPLELVQRATYRDVNTLVERGEVDLAWICTGAWPDLESAGAARIVAVPRVSGVSTYRAYIIVRAENRSRSLDDLRAATFAFTDPMSLSGCQYPLSRLRDRGEAAAKFFSRTFYTHGHDVSIEAVRRGYADAASVDSLVFDFLALRSPGEVDGLRVLETSSPFPIPPLVVPARAEGREADELVTELLRFADDEVGRRLLGQIGVEAFARQDSAVYARFQMATRP